MFRNLSQKIVTWLVLLVAFFPREIKAQIFAPIENPEETGVGLIRDELRESKVAGTEDFADLILKYVNFSLPYLSLAAFVGFVYAGFLYVTAYGNDEQLQKSKKIMIYAIAGLVLVILSFSIVQLFTESLTEGIQ